MRSIIIYLFSLAIVISSSKGSIFAQTQDILFDHLTNEDGLGSSTIHSVTQDKEGFMWFASSGGLYRYDGYQLRAFLNNPQDTTSILDNRVNSLLVGSDNTIYVGTWDRGLSIYDQKTESFTNYYNGSKAHPINANQVKCLFEDSKKNIWLGLAEDGGLNLLNKKTKQFKHYAVTPTDKGNNRCMAIAEDKNGLLWIATYDNGLYTFNPKTEKFTKIYINDPYASKMSGWAKRIKFDDKGNLWVVTCGSGMYCYHPESKMVKHWDSKDKRLACDNIWDIQFESSGRAWLATDGEGLVLMDIDKEIFTHYKNEANNPKSINTDAIYCLFKDNTNILWVGTFNGGVNIYNPNKLKFPCYRPIFNDPSSLSNKSILCLLEDEEHNIWIGTDGGGLNLYNPMKYGDKFIHFHSDPNNKEKTAPDVVKSIYLDGEGRIWLGTWGRGVALFDPKKNTFDYSISKKTNINTGGVWFIVEDVDKSVWISELGIGMKRIDPKTFQYKNYGVNSYTGLYNPVFLSAKMDSKHRFWVGSEGSGIFLYDRKNDKFKNYANKPEDSKSVAGNIIRTIFEDHRGRMWFGTLGHGMSLFNENDGSFTNFSEKDGLIGNTVNSILEDKYGTLWISTNNGLMKFNPDTKKIKGYDKLDGLQGNDFNYNSSLLTSAGVMMFGGVNGMNVFDPDKILDNAYRPPVFVTGISIFNHPVKMNDETGILHQSILETNSITLTHKQSVVTFTFSGLNFTHAQKNAYAYMLEPFESKWNYVGNKKEATYTNLDPGEYVFRVKASNNDGVWNEKGISISITILPPFWKTWWFRILVFVLVAGATLGFFTWRIKALKAQKELLEIKVKERTKKLNESNILLKERQDEIMQQSEELQQQAEELLSQRDALTNQNKKISEQNNHITASVRYAQTLQNAILPSLDPLGDHLEYFKIYQPKDIVSGDFYWYANLNKENPLPDHSTDRYILSVIDCTGHGVPGAFMTLVADRLMNEAVVEHQIIDPALILEELDKGVQAILKQNTTTNRDGMDLVVCLFEHRSDLSVDITFAGSKNPLFYYDCANHQIVKVEADRRYIGMMTTKNRPSDFTNKKINVKKGDLVFLCTDGYIDQSNDERKRLGSRLFVDYLLEFAHLPVIQIKDQLEQRLKEWQGNQTQRDDISLIGIRI